MGIYTKMGDDGTSTLFTSLRIPKYDKRFELLGAIDELSSHLGLVRALITESSNGSKYEEPGAAAKEAAFVKLIQHRLIQISAHIYNPENTGYFTPLSDITALETNIDEVQKVFPIKGLVIPGGTVLAAEADIARTVARRAERLAAAVSIEHPIEENSRKYLNRLSDYLFMLARSRTGEE